MQQASHTPAEWEVRPCPCQATECNVIIADGVQIAEAVRGDAAARLMAAAPDLLAKLKEIRLWLDADVCGPWDAKFVAEIDALLLKAEGLPLSDLTAR